MLLPSFLSSRQSAGSSRRKNTFHTKPVIEVLEDRQVPTVSLLSALGTGSETGPSRAYDVATDNLGNTFSTGSFSGTVDFDPNGVLPGGGDVLTSAGSLDAYVAKYAPDNSLVWAIQMGGNASDPGTDHGRGIELDAFGNIYVTGSFRDTAQFGSFTLTSSPGGKDGFVAKLSSQGTVLWVRQWGLSDVDVYSGETGVSVDTDASGNVYVLGTRARSDAPDGYDFLKFNSSGTPQWAKYISTDIQAGGSDMVVDNSGNLFIAGIFSDTVDFDPNAGTRNINDGPGAYSGFVLKLTSSGAFSWVTPFISQSQTISGNTTYGYSTAQSIALDASGNVIVGGFYGNKVDFNPGNSTTNLPTVGGGFITKLKSNGSLTWAKPLLRSGATSDMVFLYDLAIDSTGNIYATGAYAGTIDFNPGTGIASKTSAGEMDTYVLKLDASGNFGWVESFGGAGTDIGYGIAVDSTGTLHFSGTFLGMVDFDPNPTDQFFLTSPGTYTSLFLVRLRQN